MSKAFALAIVLVFLTPSITIIQPSKADVENRTIIVPDDYPTITVAIGNATNGDTILVRSGTYEGPINSTIAINKSLSIIGESAQNTIINLHPAYNLTWMFATPFYSYTNAITIIADSCAIEDLTLNVNPGGFITAQGNGILIANNNIMTGQPTGLTIAGSNCRVTNNKIDGMVQVYGNYNQVDANNPLSIWLGNTDNGPLFNLIEDNTCQIIGLRHSTNNVVLNNSVSGYGLDLTWSDNNFFYKNKISGMTRGVRFWLSSNNKFESNTVTFGIASLELLEFGGAYNNLFSLNNFINNRERYVYDDFSDPNTHAYVTSYSTNVWSDSNLGNYWGDYLTKFPNATEVDNSGAGNLPYVINNNNTDAYPLMSTYDISLASIQLPNWTNLNLPNLLPTPTFPSPNPSPTATPTNLLTSPQATSSTAPTPTVPELPSWTIPLLLSIMLATASFLVYHKKHKGSLVKNS
jgi:parallel beta-helix repeat protein